MTLLASSRELAEAQQFLKEYQEGVGRGREAWGKEQEAGVWKAKQCESVSDVSEVEDEDTG